MQKITRLCILASLTILPAACTSPVIKPADLTGYPLQASPAPLPVNHPPTLDVSKLEFEHTAQTHGPFVPYVGHNMGRINERYAQSLHRALYGEAAANKQVPQPILRLDRVHIVQIWGSGFVEQTLTEQATADWSLLSTDGQRTLASLSTHGKASGPSGWGATFAVHGRDRLGRMYQNLLDNSIRAFQQSEALSLVDLALPLVEDPAKAPQIAGEQWDAPAGEHTARLAKAQKWAAAATGNLPLYEVVRRKINQMDITAAADDSDLLHTALGQKNFSLELFNRLLGNSRQPDSLNQQGQRVIEAALRNHQVDAAIALLENRADSKHRLFGDSYASAETYAALAAEPGLSKPRARELIMDSIAHYRQAIVEADKAIEANQASRYASHIANVIGPSLQGMMASVQARSSARQMAAQTGSYGVGTVVYEVKRYETASATQAIELLRERIAHCRARIGTLEEQLAAE